MSSTNRARSDDSNDAFQTRLDLKQVIRARLQVLGQSVLHLTPEVASARAIEYIRFMDLKARFDVEDVESELAPSPLVDEMWHTHLLDTKSYAMLESVLLSEGKRLHHNPILEEQPNYKQRLARTKQLYLDVYHSAPPTTIWASPTEFCVEGNAEPAPKDTDRFRVYVKLQTGGAHTLMLRGIDTVLELKQSISDRTGIPEDQQKNIFGGRQLEDHHTLMHYGIRDQSTVHVVLKLRGC